jgi:hypothetical protein
MTWTTPDWVSVAVVLALVAVAAGYAFFVAWRKKRTVAPPAEHHAEMLKAA